MKTIFQKVEQKTENRSKIIKTLAFHDIGIWELKGKQKIEMSTASTRDPLPTPQFHSPTSRTK